MVVKLKIQKVFFYRGSFLTSSVRIPKVNLRRLWASHDPGGGVNTCSFFLFWQKSEYALQKINFLIIYYLYIVFLTLTFMNKSFTIMHHLYIVQFEKICTKTQNCVTDGNVRSRGEGDRSLPHTNIQNCLCSLNLCTSP